MEKQTLSSETKSLIDQLDSVLSGHKECVDECKSAYTNCIAYCGDYVCKQKCRGTLENCINGCSGLNMDSDTKIRMNKLLDKIEASLSH